MDKLISRIMDRLHAKLSLRARIMVLCGFLSLPAFVILVVLTMGNLSKITILNKEIQGSHDLTQIWSLLLVTEKNQVDQALIETIKGKFAKKPYQMEVDFPSNLKDSDALSETALGLYDKVLTVQGLILDNDEKGYFTITATYLHLPNLIEASKRYYVSISYGEEARLAAELRLLSHLDSSERAFEKAASYWTSDSSASAMGPLSAEVSAAVRQFQHSPSEQNRDRVLGIANSLYEKSNLLIVKNLEARRFNSLVFLFSQIAICLSIIALGTLIAINGVKGFSKRIITLSSILDAMKNEEPIEFVPYQSDQSETGVMARAIQFLRTELVERETAKANALQDQRQAEQKQVLLNLAAQFEMRIAALIDDVAGSSSELTYLSNDMNKVVTEAGEKACRAANATDDSRQGMQSAVEATDRINNSSYLITQKVNNSSQAASIALQDITRADEMAGKLNETMRRMGGVVDVITKITGQINLLSLNATIESARAGEAGKGFAVVAGEVKNLAAQTAKSTTEIGNLIREIQNVSGEMGQIVQNARASFDLVDGHLQDIAVTVGGQLGVQSEIAHNMQKADEGSKLIQSTISSVNDITSQAAISALKTYTHASDLSKDVENLSFIVQQFLFALRSDNPQASQVDFSHIGNRPKNDLIEEDDAISLFG